MNDKGMSRRGFLACIGTGALSAGCRDPDIVVPDANGMIVQTVGPARLKFDLDVRTVCVFNLNAGPIGIEIANYNNREIAVYHNYWIPGNTEQTSGEPIAILVPNLTVDIIVTTYTGEVTSVVAAGFKWAGGSKLKGLAQNFVATADYRVIQIGPH